MDKNIKIQIPETWSDITLTQFQTYNHEMNKDINHATKLIQTLSSLCNIKFKDAALMKIKDVNKISQDIYKLLEIVPDSMIMIFEFKGVRYGFIPKLDDISIGEYADLEFYLSDRNKIWDNMHWIMSILYREVKKEKDGKYNIKDYEPSKKRAEIFKELPMNVVYSASNFFLTLGGELVETMPNYLSQKEMEKVNQLMTETNGDGSESSTTLQEEI